MSLPIPKTMVHQLNATADRLKDAPALWTKRGGEWVSRSWRQYATRVKDFALGLAALGFSPGSVLAIMANSREEWVLGSLGAMAAGGVSTGVSVNATFEQLTFILRHSEARVVVVENDAMLGQVERARASLPALQHVVVMDEAPVRPGVHSFTEVLELGARGNEADHYARLDALQPEALAQLVYTSGTTGDAKGVMLSHHNLCWTTAQLSTCHPTSADDMLLSYLPLSHIAEQLCTIYGPLMNGLQVSFAESLDCLPENLREVRPTLFFGVPRVWEKMKTRIEAALLNEPRATQRLVEWARAVAKTMNDGVLGHRQPTISLQAKYVAAKRVLAPLKQRLGLDRAHARVTSAAPISGEVLAFFSSLDLPLAEIYGQSEGSGPTSVSTYEALKPGRAGRPMPGVEVRIADDGEILVRGGNVCLGYFKDEEATKALLSDGWLHSGDLGRLDGDGYLEVTGRKKDLIVTSGGKKIAPAPIEQRLAAIDPIGHAVVVGDRRNALVALLTLDAERARRFATLHRLELSQLVSSPTLQRHLAQRIEAMNETLARHETIKRFQVLPAELSVEGGELTATLKPKRTVIESKYRAVIEALYS